MPQLRSTGYEQKWQESQGRCKTDKKDTEAATGQDWCFGRAPYRARPGTVQATGGVEQGGLKELQKGRAAIEQCALVPERGTQDTQARLRRAALNYCKQTCPIIPPKLMVPAPTSSISVVKSMS